MRRGGSVMAVGTPLVISRYFDRAILVVVVNFVSVILYCYFSIDVFK